MKKLFWFVTLMAQISISYTQNTFELLNPKPSLEISLDIHFLSVDSGFILNKKELLATTDAGQNWFVKQNLSAAADFDFHQSTAFIVGERGYVLRSEDAGQSWEELSTEVNENFNSVHIITKDTIILSSAEILMKSFDGGSSWERLEISADVVLLKTFFVNTQVGHGVCKGGIIIKTTDGGNSWYITENANTSQSDFINVYFVNERIGFASQSNIVLKTSDGGETWHSLSYDHYSIFSFFFLNENIGYIAGDRVVYKTIDGGESWERVGFVEMFYPGYPYIRGLFFFNSDLGYATGSSGRILKTEDGGKTWLEYAPTYENINQIEFISNETGYALARNEMIKSEDGGLSWENLGIPISDLRLLSFDFVNEKVGYAVFEDTFYDLLVYKTVDGALTWNPTKFELDPVPSYGLYTIQFVDEQTGFISGGLNYPKIAKTFKTNNGGETWEEIGPLNLGQIQFLNKDIGYARNWDTYSHGIIHKTTDGGNTWNTVFETDAGINSFHFADDSVGYLISLEGDIYKTEDGGNSWMSIKNPHPYSYLSDIRFHSRSHGYLLAGNRTVYKTEDGAENWEFLGFTYQDAWQINLTVSHVYFAGAFGQIIRTDIGNVVSVFNRSTKNDDLKLFPNPTKNGFKISCESPRKIQMIAIYDQQGKMIKREIYGGASLINIVLPEMTSGLYNVMVTLADAQVVTKKIIIQ